MLKEGHLGPWSIFISYLYRNLHQEVDEDALIDLLKLTDDLPWQNSVLRKLLESNNFYKNSKDHFFENEKLSFTVIDMAKRFKAIDQSERNELFVQLYMDPSTSHKDRYSILTTLWYAAENNPKSLITVGEHCLYNLKECDVENVIEILSLSRGEGKETL